MIAGQCGQKVILSLLAGGAVLLSGMSAQADDRYPRAEMLVEAQQIVEHKLPSGTVLIDVREKPKYDTGHIPGARWIDADSWINNFGDGQGAAAWSKRIGDAGISAGSTVVLYSDNLGRTCRVWFILRYWGVNDVRLLNAGWKGWEAGGFKTEQATAAGPTVSFTAQANANRLASKQDVLQLLERKDRQIVDARSQGEFCGDDKRSNQRGGAIPGAKHLDWVNLTNNSSQRFKSAAELKELFAAAGIDPASSITTHCQSGGRASVMMFALELMGAPDVTNYYRGWSEWGNVDDTPIERGRAD